eukprot:jgi/Hompol1/4835/HPOL_003926-RA
MQIIALIAASLSVASAAVVPAYSICKTFSATVTSSNGAQSTVTAPYCGDTNSVYSGTYLSRGATCNDSNNQITFWPAVPAGTNVILKLCMIP